MVIVQHKYNMYPESILETVMILMYIICSNLTMWFAPTTKSHGYTVPPFLPRGTGFTSGLFAKKFLDGQFMNRSLNMCHYIYKYDELI